MVSLCFRKKIFLGNWGASSGLRQVKRDKVTPKSQPPGTGQWYEEGCERLFTGYSVGKVQVPAGINNRLPANVALSIALLF